MKKTYKKLVANKYTRDFRDAGEVIEVEVPTPGPREVLLENKYGGVNASDVNIAGGVYFSDGDFPFDLGCESIGEVIGIGSEVTELALGDFAVSPELGSAYSELLCRDVSFFTKVPECTPEIMGCAVAGMTAAVGLNVVGEMKAGETVLVTAAAGGVGSWCVQLAKLAGCHVIGTCSTPEKADSLKSLGCDRVVNYRKEDLGEILSSEYPDGIDLVFEQVGQETFDACVDNIALRGRILICGFVSEYTSGPQDHTAPRIYHKLLWKSASIKAFLFAHWPEELPGQLQYLVDLVATGKLDPVIDTAVFEGVDDAINAVEFLHSGKNTGKVIVRY